MRKGRKRTTKVVMISLFISVFVLTTGCGDSKKELRKANEDLRQENQEADKTIKEQSEEINKLELENSSLKKKVDVNESSSYIGWKFYTDGYYYYVDDEDFKFYTDTACQNEAKNVRIISEVVSEDKLQNGITIYTVLSDGGLLYSVEEPYLEKQE